MHILVTIFFSGNENKQVKDFMKAFTIVFY